MAGNNKTEENKAPSDKEFDKVCFIIMPIADATGYDSGHFTRVYNHLIKPACEEAGFKPIRADDVSSSHFIVVDILKKIVESDLAICDLSGRNPNVLYELGLRQAFNKKTVLIKDNKTENIFDVQGFRYAQYDSALRIDNVKSEILKLATALKETYEANSDINSIVQLLQIEPAKIDNKTVLTASDTVLFRAIADLKESVERISLGTDKPTSKRNVLFKNKLLKLGLFNGAKYYIKDSNGTEFGTFIDTDHESNSVIFVKNDGSLLSIDINDPMLTDIDEIPF
jgi:hypothetical protein